VRAICDSIEEVNNTSCVRYKQRVLCYFLSHVDAIASPGAQLVLLRSIKNVSDPVKAQLLHPTINKLVQPTTRRETLNDIYGIHLKEFTALVFSSFDQSIANDLNETHDDLWPTFLLCIDYVFKSGMLIVLLRVNLLNSVLESASSPRAALVEGLEGGLFTSLSLERKVEVCNHVLQWGIRDPGMVRVFITSPLPIHI
jgi:U3 small nucleolar RNA-associated protein 10